MASRAHALLVAALLVGCSPARPTTLPTLPPLAPMTSCVGAIDAVEGSREVGDEGLLKDALGDAGKSNLFTAKTFETKRNQIVARYRSAPVVRYSP